MTPDEIKAWQQQHGGDAGADPPDANGVTVYRAADGSFINIRRDGSVAMRGSGPPPAAAPPAAGRPGIVTPVPGWPAQLPQAPAASAAPAPAPAPAPAAAPAEAGPVRGGGGMQQADVEAWIAQQGGTGRVQYARATQRVANPALKATLPDGSDNPDYQPGAPPTITVPEESWTAVDAGGKPTGALLHVSRRPDGSFDIVKQANANPTAKQTAADAGTPIGSRQVTDANGLTTKVTTYQRADGTTYDKTDSEQAAPAKPQVIQSTVNTTSPRQGVLMPDGSVQWSPNPNYQNPNPQPVAVPGNPRNVIWDDGPGKPLRVEKNPLYEAPHKVEFDQRSGKWIDITVDPDTGKPVIESVASNIAIKPAELPVLQARYGEIAQGLGKIAEDLNGKFARGEITEQQRDAAWKAAHAQAETQVSEINSILENSKAIWSGQVTQRGQSLSETQSRRSFASDAAGRAISAGSTVAQGALPGHGKEIVAGVEALMRMQQRYAAGMGGFRESPEVGLPPALEQARGIGLPGYPMPAAPGGLPAGPSGPGGAPGAVAGPGGPGGSPTPPNALGVGAIGSLPAPGGAPPSGISNTTDAGGDVGRGAADIPALEGPREYTPASSTVGPPMAGMGAALEGAQAYAGAPVAAGGAGLWDPSLAMQGMLGQGGDPAWEEAVRRAAAGFGRVR